MPWGIVLMQCVPVANIEFLGIAVATDHLVFTGIGCHIADSVCGDH